MRNKTIIRASVLLLSIAIGCRQLRDDSDLRASRARGSSSPVVIAVVWPEGQGDEDLFWKGIDTAAAKIEAEGGILGRKLEIRRKGDDGSVAHGKTIAEELTDDLDVVAVLGYREPNVAMVASIMYEYAGVAVIALGSGAGHVTRDGFDLVFRTLPSDEEFGASLADHAHASRYSRVLIVYENDTTGRTVANAFEARAEDHRIAVIDRIAFDRGSIRGLEQGLLAIKSSKLDAVLLASKLPGAGDALAAIRKDLPDTPILGTDGLDSSALLDRTDATKVVIASVFHPGLQGSEVTAFVNAYRTLNKNDPDTWAAQGYDGLSMLAQAIKLAKSTEPKKIAEALRAKDGFRGATGTVRFDARGDAIGRNLVFKRVKNGKFELVGAKSVEEKIEKGEKR